MPNTLCVTPEQHSHVSNENTLSVSASDEVIECSSYSSSVKFTCHKTKFIGCVFDNVDLMAEKQDDSHSFELSVFNCCTFKDMKIDGCDFFRCTFTNSNMDSEGEVVFKNVHFVDVMFNARGISFDKTVIFDNCRFEGCLFDPTHIENLYISSGIIVRDMYEINLNRMLNERPLTSSVLEYLMSSKIDMRNLTLPPYIFGSLLLTKDKFTKLKVMSDDVDRSGPLTGKHSKREFISCGLHHFQVDHLSMSSFKSKGLILENMDISHMKVHGEMRDTTILQSSLVSSSFVGNLHELSFNNCKLSEVSFNCHTGPLSVIIATCQLSDVKFRSDTSYKISIKCSVLNRVEFFSVDFSNNLEVSYSLMIGCIFSGSLLPHQHVDQLLENTLLFPPQPSSDNALQHCSLFSGRNEEKSYVVNEIIHTRVGILPHIVLMAHLSNEMQRKKIFNNSEREDSIISLVAAIWGMWRCSQLLGISRSADQGKIQSTKRILATQWIKTQRHLPENLIERVGRLCFP